MHGGNGITGKYMLHIHPQYRLLIAQVIRPQVIL